MKISKINPYMREHVSELRQRYRFSKQERREVMAEMRRNRLSNRRQITLDEAVQSTIIARGTLFGAGGLAAGLVPAGFGYIIADTTQGDGMVESTVSAIASTVAYGGVAVAATLLTGAMAYTFYKSLPPRKQPKPS